MNNLMYMLGAFVGDGSMVLSPRKSIDDVWKITFIYKDGDMRDSIRDAFLKLDPEVNINEYKTETPKEVYYSISLVSNKIGNYINKYCGYTHNKRVPMLDESDAWEFLSGFIDTDGTVSCLKSSRRIQLLNTDLVIIEGLKKLLDKLGISYSQTYQEFPNRPQNKTMHHLNIKSCDYWKLKFNLRIPHKAERLHSLKYNCQIPLEEALKIKTFDEICSKMSDGSRFINGKYTTISSKFLI